MRQDWVTSFRGKKILVTGDTGFKGSWLSYWLVKLGADVVGVALPADEDKKNFKLLKLDQCIEHIDLDIRNLDHLNKIFKEKNFNLVFHLAAQAIVKASYENPVDTFTANFNGSLNILECVRHAPSVCSLIYVTSDKCYKNKEWEWGYRENDELGGDDPYSASKASAELLFWSYYQSFLKQRTRFGCATVRAGNVIGGGDFSAFRLVPDCMKALLEKRPLIIRNPHATRPWQHVLDPIRGYLSLAGKLLDDPQNYSGSWNFGPAIGSNRTVKELAAAVIKAWGHGELSVASNDNAVHEARLLHLNCDKAYQKLSWQPVWDFEQTVIQTVNWYKEFGQRTNLQKFADVQIETYMSDLQQKP